MQRSSVPWIDGEVRSLWGTKAAVRVLGIATDGWDVEPVGAMTNRKPSEIRTNRIGEVPGLDATVSNLFGVSQVLSWIVGYNSAGRSAKTFSGGVKCKISLRSSTSNKFLGQ